MGETVSLYLSGERKADDLLATDPFALLVGMVLDQQIPLERAFSAPLALQERIGEYSATSIAAMDPTALAAAFSEKPALHRFPASMAERVQAVARVVVEAYGGDAAGIWTTAASGAELLKNLRALPGFGEQKARIFIGLLGKRLNIRPDGWEAAAGNFGKPGTHSSIADIDSPEALAMVREYKKEMKAAAKASAAAAPKATRSSAR